jgi:hypothetical protein
MKKLILNTTITASLIIICTVNVNAQTKSADDATLIKKETKASSKIVAPKSVDQKLKTTTAKPKTAIKTKVATPKKTSSKAIPADKVLKKIPMKPTPTQPLKKNE